ncbi:MAG: deoxyribose-phosphate aldolase [Bacillota bacterium]|jgi:deoxyribose-phosphate aldolase
MNISAKAAFINHTNLSPTASEIAIYRLCQDAVEQGFNSVCILPVHVPIVAQKLAGSDVKIATVVGFPLGGHVAAIKAAEAAQAFRDGATVIEMVINLPKFKSHDYEYVQREIQEVVKAAPKATLKVIIENAYLDNEEKKQACLLAKKSGAVIVKSSTGFVKAGANIADIALMRHVVGEDMGVEACGGITLLETMEALLRAGADAIGTSAGLAIMEEYRNIITNNTGAI